MSGAGIQHTVITRGLKVEEGILVCLRGPNSGREYILIGDEIVLGRGDDCDIILNDINASRQHAIIRVQSGKYQVKDNKSKNGTFINDKQVHYGSLREGDTLTVGESVFRFRFGRPNTTRTRSSKLTPVAPKSRASGAADVIAAAASGFHAALISHKGWRMPQLQNLQRSGGMLAKLFETGSKQLMRLLQRGAMKAPKMRHNNKRSRLLVMIGVGALLLTVAGQFKGGRKTATAPTTAVVNSGNQHAPVVKVISKEAPASTIRTASINTGNTGSASTARERYSQGMQALDGGDFKSAIALFDEVLRNDATHPVAKSKGETARARLSDQIQEYYNSGLREFAKLYYDRAIQEWEKTAALSQGFSADYFDKANSKIKEARQKLLESR